MLDEVLTLVGVVASVALSALVAGRQVGNLEQRVVGLETRLADTALKVTVMDGARIQEAREQGAQAQRLKMLEDHVPNNNREMAQLEARFRAEVKATEDRVISHFDRVVTVMKETSGLHRAADYRQKGV